MKLNGMNINTKSHISDEERTYATWMHIAGLSGYLIPVIGNFLVPLILWSLKHKDSHYIDQQGREVMNFQLTIYFYSIFTWIFTFLLVGWLFVPVVFLLHLIGTIMGAVRTWEGKIFHYPITFRPIRSA